MGSTGQCRFDTSSVIPLWLDGKQVTTSTTFEVISPLTSKPLYRSCAASENDALAAIEAASKAQPGWATTKPSERRDLFLRAASEFERRKDELLEFCKSETATTEPYFAFDFGDCLESVKSCAGLIQGALDGKVPLTLEEGRSAMLIQEPYGVVLSIAPWNAPCILGTRSFLAPLASRYSPSFF